MHVCMAEGAGWGWSQLLREQGHLLEWPGNCEQRSPPTPPQEGVKGPRPLLLADTNVPVVDAKAGTPNCCLVRERACPHRNLRPCWLVPSSLQAPNTHSWRERRQQQCAQLSKGHGQASTTSCGCFLQRQPAVCPSCLHLPGTELLWD